MNRPCECEHITHTEAPAAGAPPNAHAFGEVEAEVNVKTDYGTFAVCVDCHAARHMVSEVENAR
jgi:hypothetical protein